METPARKKMGGGSDIVHVEAKYLDSVEYPKV